MRKMTATVPASHRGGRNGKWKAHPDAEQTLMILSGEAYYQEEGKEKQLLRAGK